MSQRKPLGFEYNGSRLLRFFYLNLPLVTIILLVGMKVAMAQTPSIKQELSSLWLLIAGALVFFINAGFALLETGTSIISRHRVFEPRPLSASWERG
ncbi:ammonium transporter [Fischerella thermalis]|uniref:ammonium transporter n=1 Tax=Fischerella thermalis TaxID=372787 RepID=UPI000CC6EF0A|nr:ammonium transporter [Fischerella thermalis]PMB01321.1 hypothetical protein CI594_09660 [Fischerella thermalis CCMEE 5196]